MLNDRMVKILNLFLKQEILYLSDLCNLFKIQKRSVIKCIDDLNQLLQKNNLKIIFFREDWISYILKEETFQFLLSKLAYVYSPWERINWLIFNVLINEKIDENCYYNLFKVSKSLFEKDFFYLKNFFETNHIQFSFKPNNKFKILIDELKRRKIVINIIKEIINTKLETILLLKTNISLNIFKVLKTQFKFSLSKDSELLLNFSIEFIRTAIENSKTVIIETKDLEQLKKYSQFNFLKILFKKELKTENENEIGYFLILLISNSIIFEFELDNVLAKTIKQAIFEFIFEVERKSFFIFNNKKGLVKEVFLHFLPSYYRMKYGFQLFFNFHEIIEKKYQIYYNQLKSSIWIIESHLKIQFNSKELALFLIYFILNLNQNIQKQKYQAAIINNSGISIAKILKSEIENLFNDIFITKIGSFEEIWKTQSEYDFIFATDKYEQKEIIILNKIISKNDIHKINFLLNKKKLSKTSYRLSNVLYLEHIKIFKQNYSWTKAIELSAQSLFINRYFSLNYLKSMINNIKKYGPYIILKKGLAIPHSSKMNWVNEVGISLTVFKKTVIFDKSDDSKQANIFITFCSPDNSSHLQALFEIIEIVKQKKFFVKILKAKNEKEIYELIFPKKIIGEYHEKLFKS